MNLVIGNTSQLAYYFPESFVKISSRNISDDVFKTKWDDIYICFAEQRTFLEDDELFFRTNCAYTAHVIDKLKYRRLYFYSTIYLWDAYEGEIDISMPFKYYAHPYTNSKVPITKYIMSLENTTVLFPCNFNSIYRKGGFLFGKVFDSIKNKKKITIGNVDFLKEMTHPKRVVAESFVTEHKLIRGCLVNVKEVIEELYKRNGLDYDKLVTEEGDMHTSTKQKVPQTDYTQEDLIVDMLYD